MPDRPARKSAISQKDIARHSGVNQSTVSRVLGGKPYVDAATAARVRATTAALGYDPNANDVARRLVSRRRGVRLKHHVVALVFPELIFDDPYFAAIARGATYALCDAGYAALWLLTTLAHTFRTLEELPPALRRGEMDGVIVCLPHPRSLTTLNSVAAALPTPLPLISLLRAGDAPVGVSADEEGGAYAAMRHLLALGHRHVLQCIDDSWHIGESPQLERRVGGLRRALHEAGLAPEAHLHLVPAGAGWMNPATLAAYTAHLTPAQARQHPLVAYLRAHPQITALLGVNDAVALHAWATLAAAGLRVPEDYSLLGFDDTLAGPTPCGPNQLTTVRLPLEAIGREGVHLLCAALDAPPPSPPHRVLPTELIVRGSTALAAVRA